MSLEKLTEYEVKNTHRICGGTNGAPGVGVNIRVRGIGSVNLASTGGQPGASATILL